MLRIEYEPTPKQRMFHGSCADEILYGGAAGGGKLLDITKVIPTTNGWVTMGDIQVGDEVFGMDGMPHAVTRVSPIEIAPAWKLVFDDGSEAICNDDHLWLTYDAQELGALTRRSDGFRERRRAKRPSRATGKRSKAFTDAITKRNTENPPATKDAPTGRVKETSEIVATLTVRGGRANHAIPVTKAIQLPEREFMLEPYLLGLWLGDGTKNSGGFTGIDGLEQAFVGAGFTVTTNKNKKSHYIKGFVQIIRRMGLYRNKHVPDEYLWASEGQRLALLQGLMDTDGNCNLNGSAEFVNTNKQLTDSVAFLIRSLGMKATVREGRAKLNGRDCGPKWSIKFVPSMPVFRLQRKLDRQHTELRRTAKFRYIVSAERVEPTAMRCIAIDSPDHLYLCGESFIPTHNSKAIVMDAFLRCVTYPMTHAFIFRRTYGELEDTIIKEAKESYPESVYKYNGGRHEMTLINGSGIHFRHCSSVSDMYNYKGAEIQWLYFDELTTFEYEIYDFIKTRLRAKKKLGIIPCVRSASNPGDIGHTWVKKMFVDAAKPMDIFERVVMSRGKKKILRLQFIPSLLSENPYIGDDYEFQLASKPKALREALLNGDWNAFEGQVFVEWTDLVNKVDPSEEDKANLALRRWTHVVKPFEIKDNWPRYMSFDHGYSRPFSVGWWAIGPDGCAYRYREWYGCERGRANIGIMLTPRQIAEGILEREKYEIANNIVIDRIADPSIFDRSRGDSVAQQMEPQSSVGLRGVLFRPGDNTRMAGKAQIHERLRFNEDGKPLMQVFDTCEDFIRVLPGLPYSLTKVEDVNTDAEDHIFDETRYLCMGRPVPLRHVEPIVHVPYDPFRRAK